jgi:hypothetical protein
MTEILIGIGLVMTAVVGLRLISKAWERSQIEPSSSPTTETAVDSDPKNEHWRLRPEDVHKQRLMERTHPSDWTNSTTSELFGELGDVYNLKRLTSMVKSVLGT